MNIAQEVPKLTERNAGFYLNQKPMPLFGSKAWGIRDVASLLEDGQDLDGDKS